VNGTVNDLAVSGAKAEAMVVTYVLEAGLPTPILEAEARAMGNAARKAGVTIAGGTQKWSSTEKPIPCTSQPLESDVLSMD